MESRVNGNTPFKIKVWQVLGGGRTVSTTTGGSGWHIPCCVASSWGSGELKPVVLHPQGDYMVNFWPLSKSSRIP